MLTNSCVPFKASYPSRNKNILASYAHLKYRRTLYFPEFHNTIFQVLNRSKYGRNLTKFQMMYHLDIILDTAISEHLLSPHLTWNVISDNVFLSICQLLLFVFMPWLLLHVWKWIILSAGIQFFYSLNLKLRNERKKYKNSVYNWTSLIISYTLFHFL